MQRTQGARNPLRPARILCAKPFMLVEVAGNRAPGAEIGVERVAGARLDDANEGAAEHDLPWFEGDVVGGEFVGKPGDAVGRVTEDRGGDARLVRRARLFDAGGQRADGLLVQHLDTSSLEHLAAIDRDVLAGDPAGERRTKEQCNLCYLLRPAEAPERDASEDAAIEVRIV